jgi:anti-anti-sigma factor
METKIDGTVLMIAGLEEFTAANAGVFRTQVCAALNGHSVVEVDLSRTTAMDCAGLGALVAVRNLAHRRNGAVRLMGATPVVQRLFEVVRAEDLFEVVNVKAQEKPSFVGAGERSPSNSSLVSAFD